jgi:hypothetical protein
MIWIFLHQVGELPSASTGLEIPGKEQIMDTAAASVWGGLFLGFSSMPFTYSLGTANILYGHALPRPPTSLAFESSSVQLLQLHECSLERNLYRE